MVWQKYALGLTHDKIAINLCVDKSTVSRTIELFQTTGSVSKRSYPTDRAYMSPSQLFILTPSIGTARDIYIFMKCREN